MKGWDNLNSLIEALKSLPNALKDLSSAIRATKESSTAQEERDVRVTAEIRLINQQISERRANQDEQTSLQRSIKNAAWFAFWAAFGYAGISFCQWQEMKKQTVEANRAWIGIEAPVFKQVAQIGQPVQIEIPYLNFGRSPGLNGKFSVFIDVIDSPAANGVFDATKLPNVSEEFCETSLPNVAAGTVFTETNAATLRVSSGDFGVTWTPEMQRGEKLLRLRSCIAYETFEKQRHTWVCKVFWSGAFVADKPGILVGFNCPNGGGAD